MIFVDVIDEFSDILKKPSTPHDRASNLNSFHGGTDVTMSN